MTQWLDKTLYQWKKVIRKPVDDGKVRKNVIPDFQFSLNELIALNANLQLAKYDLHVMNSAPMLIAKGIDFFFDYKLYQISETSLIRKHAVRLLINIKTCNAVELNGDNESTYGIISEIFQAQFEQPELNEREKNELLLAWVERNLLKYSLFFFDNTRGNNGRFEIVMDFPQIQNRIETYYHLNMAHLKAETKLDRDDLARVEKGNLLIDGIFEYVQQNSLKITSYKDVSVISNLLLIFKNSLFTAQLVFYTKDENFGQINLQNECVIALEDSKVIEVPVKDSKKRGYLNDIPLRIASYS